MTEQSDWEAFLDIETTGFHPFYNEVTVVGIYLTRDTEEKLVQLIGEKICGESILNALEGVSRLYTYNGHRFDLPFLAARYGIDLESLFDHCDLMHHCWRNHLYGGLKKVEVSLGISRQLKEVNGLEAVRLWWRYVNDYDRAALKTLLDYNREDIVNLKILRDRLIR